MTLTELVIRGIAAALLIAISYLPFWYYAENLFRFNFKLRNNAPFLFKIIGVDEKNLDNKDKWIKNFRRKIICITIFGYLLLALILYLNMDIVR